MHKILLLLIAFSSCTNDTSLVEDPRELKTPAFHVESDGTLVCDNADEDLFYFDVNLSAPPEQICGWHCVDHPSGRGHFHVVKFSYADGTWWLGMDQQTDCDDDCLWWDRKVTP